MQLELHPLRQDVLVIRADESLNGPSAGMLANDVARRTAGVPGGVSGGASGGAGAALSKVVVDCSRLEFLSTPGIAVLLQLHSKLRQQGGDVKLCGVAANIVNVLRITKLDKVFQVFPDADKAIAAFT